MGTAGVEDGTTVAADVDDDQWFDRPTALSLGIVVTVAVFSATARSTAIGQEDLGGKGVLLLLFLVPHAVFCWSTWAYRLFCVLWALCTGFFAIAGGAFGAPPFWWPLVMVLFVVVAFILRAPTPQRRGIGLVAGASAFAAVAVLALSATTPPSPMQLLMAEPAVRALPSGAALDSESHSATCQDWFDGVEPELFRSYSLTTSADAARRDLEHQLERLGWTRDSFGSYTKVVGDHTFDLRVEAPTAQTLTLRGYVSSFRFC